MKFLDSYSKSALFVAGLSYFGSATANVTVLANIESSVSHQTFKSEERNKTNELMALEIIPRVSLNYESKRFRGTWSATHNMVGRDLDNTSQTDNYTEYVYDSSLVVIENLLTLQAKGALTYLNSNANGFINNDFLLNPEDLSKSRSNSYGFVSRLPGNRYFSAAVDGFYSDTQSEQRANSSINLDNDSITVRGRIQSDDGFDRLYWDAESSFVSTDRTTNEDFKTRMAKANLSYRVYGNLGATVQGTVEDNQIGSNQSEFSSLRSYESAGVGLEYRESKQRVIGITLNTYDQSGGLEPDSENDDTFIGVNLDWAFSNRTQISAEYGRRFLGETGQFSFFHNTKSFRTRLSYNEELTTFSRLLANPESLGVFVCSNNVIDISSCFQPNSLTYELQPGESFVQFSQQNAEINDEVVIRKAFSGQLGFDRNRLKVSLDGRYELNDFLETLRQQRIWSASLTTTLAIGAYTNFNTALSYSNTAQRVGGDIGNNGESETIEGRIGLSRQLSKDLTIEGDVRYQERQGDSIYGVTGQGLFSGANVSERRITFSVRYTIK